MERGERERGRGGEEGKGRRGAGEGGGGGVGEGGEREVAVVPLFSGSDGSCERIPLPAQIPVAGTSAGQVHQRRGKRARVPPASVNSLQDASRWHRQPLKHEPGWAVWFQESREPEVWRVRYVVKRSKLMEHVEEEKRKEEQRNTDRMCAKGQEGVVSGDRGEVARGGDGEGVTFGGEHMLGLYAARRYESGDAITVYVGSDIGAADGAIDDYTGYHVMENMERDGGGRHVMQIGDRLIDGERGFTMAQYINSAYKVRGWVNKAEMKGPNNAGGGGTIRVMKGKVIQEGDEVLMAYHDSYWSRWDDERRERRKRCKRGQHERGEHAAGGGGRGDPGHAGVGGWAAQRAKCARRESAGASGEEPGPSHAGDDDGGGSSGGERDVGVGVQRGGGRWWGEAADGGRVLPMGVGRGAEEGGGHAGSGGVLPHGEQVGRGWVEQGGGVRVVPEAGRRGRLGGGGRGAGVQRGQRQAQTADVIDGGGRGRRRAAPLAVRWTAVAREAYQRAQNKFGRGEGGGVT